LDGIPTRSQRRYSYRCDCLIHHLSARRHNLIARGAAGYRCRHCGGPLSRMQER
jgi:SprT protein